MSRFALVAAVVGVGILVPAAAAQQFRANVVSWSPNDVRPGEPVAVVLTFHAEPVHGADGRRHIAVVIRGRGRARRFAATPLGSGRYRARIVFPEDGSWAIRVRYHGGETALGKGAACVGDCGEAEQMRTSRASGHGWIAIGLAIAGAVVVLAALSRRRLRAS